MKNPSVIVKTENTPTSFPWSQGVRLRLLGDCSKLLTLQKELSVIKGMVHDDLQRHGVSFKSVTIKIDFIN